MGSYVEENPPKMGRCVCVCVCVCGGGGGGGGGVCNFMSTVNLLVRIVTWTAEQQKALKRQLFGLGRQYSGPVLSPPMREHVLRM